MWVLALGTFDFSLEQAILAPALPAILREYEASATSVTWLVSGFLVTAAVALPLGGRLGDRYGRRRVMLWSLFAYVLGSLVCVLADNIVTLIAGRMIQGMGAGVSPLAVALVRDQVRESELPNAIGLLVGAEGSAGSSACCAEVGLSTTCPPPRCSGSSPWWRRLKSARPDGRTR